MKFASILMTGGSGGTSPSVNVPIARFVGTQGKTEAAVAPVNADLGAVSSDTGSATTLHYETVRVSDSVNEGDSLVVALDFYDKAIV